MKSLKLIRLAAALFAVMALGYGCDDDGQKTYTVPSYVVLEDARLDVSTGSIALSAVYNGDDTGIDNVRFLVWKQGQETSPEYVDCKWSGGRADAVIAGLEKDGTYYYNMEITTVGGNVIKSSEPAVFSLAEPSDFILKTATTKTSKILMIEYSGADEYIQSSSLEIVDSEGNAVNEAPGVSCVDGVARAIFFLDEWKEDLYTVKLVLGIYGGGIITSQEFKFSLLPLPENLKLSPVEMMDGTLKFSAVYDGEDKTVEKATFTLCDKAGNVLNVLDGVCSDRTARAEVSGKDYGKYMVSCVLDLVDGSSLSDGPLAFTYARPRAFENMLLEPIPMSEAGLVKSSADCNDPTQFTYAGFQWESQYLYARTSSGKTTLYVSSKYKGYFQNLTPFENGIKTLYINHSSGKDTDKFKCFGKAGSKDEWTQMPEAEKTGNTFVYDLSGDHYCYFRFETTTQELKANSFSLDYYTEAPEEY